jgi:hypothetical protein
MISAMARVTKAAGEMIIRQGDKGTEFFILERGSADVRCQPPLLASLLLRPPRLTIEWCRCW